MAHGVLTPRLRGVAGLTSLVAGAGLLVAALAGPAAAHESTVEPKPKDEGLSCPELAEEHAGGQAWQYYTTEDVADGDHSETYTVDDIGTVTVTVKSGKTFEWSSTFGIDAIYVQGRDAELSPNSYFYLYAANADSQEATGDVDLGTPPWHKWDTNKIKSITFCFDENKTTTTSEYPTTSESPTTSEAPTTSSTDTTMPSTTTTTPVVSVTTAPPTVPVTTPPGTLPKTGSDNTGLLLPLGGVLVLGGGALLATTRIFRRPSG
jgi:LPXTG-motif cell wall-anchored protein